MRPARIVDAATLDLRRMVALGTDVAGAVRQRPALVRCRRHGGAGGGRARLAAADVSRLRRPDQKRGRRHQERRRRPLRRSRRRSFWSGSSVASRGPTSTSRARRSPRSRSRGSMGAERAAMVRTFVELALCRVDTHVNRVVLHTPGFHTLPSDAARPVRPRFAEAGEGGGDGFGPLEIHAPRRGADRAATSNSRPAETPCRRRGRPAPPSATFFASVIAAARPVAYLLDVKRVVKSGGSAGIRAPAARRSRTAGRSKRRAVRGRCHGSGRA